MNQAIRNITFTTLTSHHASHTVHITHLRVPQVEAVAVAVPQLRTLTAACRSTVAQTCQAHQALHR